MPNFRLAAAAVLCVALGTSAPAQPAAQRIVVWSFGFSPQPLQLRAGRPITLTFENRSGSSHDFTAKGFFASSRILAGSAPDGEIELRPHESKTITLIPRAGTWKAHCSHFLHSTLGMTDTIVVN
jgi:plastocyanin